MFAKYLILAVTLCERMYVSYNESTFNFQHPIFIKRTLLKIFHSTKCLRTPFGLLACVCKFYLRRRKFGQNRIFLVLWESSENQFVRPKEQGRQNLRKLFEISPPPLEKILDLLLILQLDQLTRAKISYHDRT